jgi:membrane glycosyltransferase
MGLLRIPEEAVYPLEMQRRDQFLDEFSNAIDLISLQSLLSDLALADRHFAMAGSLPQALRGRPDMDAAGAKLKLADAGSLSEAMSWLNRRELMATLTDRALFDHLVKTSNNSAA